MKKLFRIKEALSIFGVSNSTFYDWITQGLMTPGVRVGSRTVIWPENELEAIRSAWVAGKEEDEIKALVEELIEARQEAA